MKKLNLSGLPSAFISVLPYLILTIVFLLPWLTVSHDMWDGVLIEYASTVGRFDGIQHWFYESGWAVQYWFTRGVIHVAEIFNISYLSLSKILTFIFLSIVVRETILLSKRILNLERPWAIFSGCLIATFPVWSVFYSTVMLFHLACYSLSLITVRYIHSESRAFKYIGLSTLPLLFFLQSLLIFLPFLSYCYDTSNKKIQHSILLPFPSKRTILILISAVLFFVITKLLFKPSGLYENYNQLVFTDWSGIKIFIHQLMRFSTIWIPMVVILLTLVIASIASSRSKIIQLVRQLNGINFQVLVGLLLLSIASVLPYAAVGKGIIIWDSIDWIGRQALLASLPISILSAYLLNLIYRGSTAKHIPGLVKSAGLVLILFNLTMLIVGIAEKQNRYVFETQLKNLIATNKSHLDTTKLQIIGDYIPTPRFRPYESNMLVYRATGEAKWWTHISKRTDPDFSIPQHVLDKPIYQQKYISTPPDIISPCSTVIKIKVSGFSGIKNHLLNTFRTNNAARVMLAGIQKKCP